MPREFASNLRDIGAPARGFLLFVAINVISWRCMFDPLLVLFARHINMPPSWVGWLQSFLPLTMALVVFTVPLVDRLGPKRLLMRTWLSRYAAASLVFTMPLAMKWWGERAGWYVLMASILGFCVARAIGVGGWYPWLHELVKSRQRGLYFSLETSVSQFINVALAVITGLALAGDCGTPRFLTIYGIGVATGFLSVRFLTRLPGGRKAKIPEGALGGVPAYWQALRDGEYMRYCIRSSSGLICLAIFGAASVMYLRDQLKLAPGWIMILSGVGSVGAILTIRSWGRFADRHGSGQSMFLSLTGHSLAVLAWLALLPGAAWSLWLVWPLFVLVTIFAASFNTAMNRGMLCQISAENRVAYSNFFMISTSLATGVTPIAVGWMIDRYGLLGFRLCFIGAAMAGVISAAINLLWPAEGRAAVPYYSALLRPFLPQRTLARIFWITLGIEEIEAAPAENEE